MGHDAPPRWDRRMQQRLAHGEAAALGELYDRFASLVHSLAYRVLDDEDAADRITREVFGYIWEHPDSYDPKQGPLRSWVAGITRHQAVQRLRQTEAASARDSGADAPAPAEMEQKIQEASTAAGPTTSSRPCPRPCGPHWSWRTSSAGTTARPPPTSASPRTRPGAGCAWACNCCPPPTPTRPCRPPSAPRTRRARCAPPLRRPIRHKRHTPLVDRARPMRTTPARGPPHRPARATDGRCERPRRVGRPRAVRRPR